ncbi:MAG: HAD family hydrolase [Archaeoglobaceae archaeon]|nr:HAD family hydrolase [Archaeoglobaceae archaeon]MDW7989842.1 HAD family hydrolase [Archaeoglobaceae archaeon]
MFKLVALDLDGTIVEFNIPFNLIRERLGIRDGFILERILQERDEKRKAEMLKILIEFELESARNAKLVLYAKELLELLRKKKIIHGIVTRNSRRSVEIIAERFDLNFDFVISREDAKPKPSEEPIRMLIEKFKVESNETLVVGDFLFDLIAGKKARAKTALIVHRRNSNMLENFKPYADYIFYSLRELAEFLGGKNDS